MIYITIFRFVCIDRKYFNFNVFNKFLLQREINEIKRKYKKREKCEKKIIIRDILLQILKFFDNRIKNDTILHIAFCLIFANFLRIDEFIWSKIDFIVEFNKWRIIRFFRDFFWRSFHFNVFYFENRFVSQKNFDIYCNNERCRLCDNFITQSFRTIFDFNVCFFILNRSIKNFRCKIRHHRIAQRDYRFKTRWLLFESFFSSKYCNWNSQRKRFWRFDSIFEKNENSKRFCCISNSTKNTFFRFRDIIKTIELFFFSFFWRRRHFSTCFEIVKK